MNKNNLCGLPAALGLTVVLVGCRLIGSGNKEDVDLPASLVAANFPCLDGLSDGRYSCSNIDLVARLTPGHLLGEKLNDIWGWIFILAPSLQTE